MRIALGLFLVVVLYHLISDRTPGMDRESLRATWGAIASWAL